VVATPCEMTAHRPIEDGELFDGVKISDQRPYFEVRRAKSPKEMATD
jgi:hypothetical protein